jgi:proteasome accessory factor A
MGLETEYGILGDIRNPIQLSNLVVAAYKAAQGGMVAPWDHSGEDPLSDARGFRLDRAAAHPSLLTDRPDGKAPDARGALAAGPAESPAGRDATRGGGLPGTVGIVRLPKSAVYRAERDGPGAAMLANGARLYVDHAHPEYAAPETATAREAALWDKAGERVMAAAAAALRDEGVRVALYKNNADGHGASYGTHENYLLPRSLRWETLVAGITPFLVTRQVFAGSGRVGLGVCSQEAGFQLSQRADYIEAEVGLETTLNRPIVNTRDEPHADPARWRRLHVIVGDATMMDVATYLRLGATALVLRALAAVPPPDADRFAASVALASPVAAFHQVSRDLSLREKLRLRSGGHATALEIQRRYRDFTLGALGEATAGPGASSGAVETAELQRRWGEVLDGLEFDLWGVARQVEWVAKLQVLDGMRRRGGLGWGSPKLRAADLRWTDVGGEASLFRRLDAAGAVERLFDEPDVIRAVVRPPASTRAYLRGETLRRFPMAVAAAGWDRLTVSWGDGAARIDLRDPLAGSRGAVGSLLAEAGSPRALADALSAAAGG